MNLLLAVNIFLTQTLDEIKSIFKGLGFSVADGPELESDYYNFESLNFPADHPARDMQDTFFVSKDFLLRTHTTPVQIRINGKTILRLLEQLCREEFTEMKLLVREAIVCSTRWMEFMLIPM